LGQVSLLIRCNQGPLKKAYSTIFQLFILNIQTFIKSGKFPCINPSYCITPCPPQWGLEPFVVFTTIVGGFVSLEGIKGVMRFGVAYPHSELVSKTILLFSRWIIDFFRQPLTKPSLLPVILFPVKIAIHPSIYLYFAKMIIG